jgi:hypothetical protein
MRAPKLNPMELLWNKLTQPLLYHEFSSSRANKDAVAIAASEIMDAMSHAEVAKDYQQCGYIPKNAQFQEP